METSEIAFEMIDSFKVLSKGIKNFFDTKLSTNYNLSLSELNVLKIISCDFEKDKKVNISDIASELKVSKSAISQIITKLEKKGYVYRVIDEKDKKINYIYLTENSLRIYDEKKNRCKIILNDIIDVMGKDNIIELSKLLKEMSETISIVGKREKIC